MPCHAPLPHAETARAYANKSKRLAIVAETVLTVGGQRAGVGGGWHSCLASSRAEVLIILSCLRPPRLSCNASPPPASSAPQDINTNFHSSAGELQRLIPIQRCARYVRQVARRAEASVRVLAGWLAGSALTPRPPPLHPLCSKLTEVQNDVQEVLDAIGDVVNDDMEVGPRWR